MAFVPEGGVHVSLAHATDPTPAALPESLRLSPEFLARWQPDTLLGTGAFGTVYRALDRETGQRVAVKFLTRIGHRDVLERFLREGRLMARVESPRVVRLIAAGEIDGCPYLVSELCAGGTLRSRLKAGRLAPRVAVPIACDILEGLEACHALGIVHRDVKPENVLFEDSRPDGARAKVADLGIAKALGEGVALTRTGMLLGTPLYMAPEQGIGEAVSAASDVYSVGFMLHEMLAGAAPFRAPAAAEMVRMHLERPPPPLQSLVPDIPEGLARAVLRALAKRPEKRPASAAALAAELRAALGEKPRSARVKRASEPALATPRQSTPRPARPRLAWLRLGGAVAVGALAVLFAAMKLTGWTTPVETVAGPRRATELVSAGIALYRAGDLPGAEKLFAEATAADPRYARAFYNLGVTRSEQGRKLEAETCYREAIRLDPKFQLAHSNLANMLAQRGQYAEAELVHRQAVLAAPTSAQAAYNLGAFLDQRERAAEAEEMFRKAIELDPHMAIARVQMGKQLAQRGHLPESERELALALAENNELPEAHSWRGLVLEKLKRPAEVESELKAGAGRGAGSWGLRVYADYLLRQGRAADAEAPARRAVAATPEDLAALELLARVLTAQAKSVEALEVAGKAAQLRTAISKRPR